MERYDALVLSPGARPIKPPLPGIDLPGIFTLRNIPDVDLIEHWIDAHEAKRAVIVGGGFIGLEMAENMAHRGLAVTLIEKLPQVMPPLDPEMAATLHLELRAKGVDLQLGDGVQGFREREDGGLCVQTESGEVCGADIVLLAIGVRPETDLATGAGVELGERGGIRVDDRMRTNVEGIWAVGDAVEVRHVVTGESMLLPLAGPAARQGRIAADVIMGRDSRFRGVQGTSVCGLFGVTVACTGANERMLTDAGIPCEKVYLHPGHHVGYYPGAEPIELKVLFSPEDGRLLGAQAVGRGGVEKRIDVLSMAMQMGSTVYDLEEAEMCYAPQYGAAKDPVNMAGFVASNHLRGDSPVIHWPELERVDRDGADGKMPVVVDVREADEYEGGHVPGSIHIPLADLRDRLGELPRDREIWVNCGVGQRAYYGVRILRLNGFEARNLSGGMRTFTSGASGKVETSVG
jgi:NADPH-dependent 2,4-dienoyl-CoA reductase/sulfur reductase-like enzyme/rhodanese-related sulfurtransferase